MSTLSERSQMSSRPLSDLLAKIDQGAVIEVEVIDLTGNNPLASNDAYIQLTTNLARLNQFESVARELQRLYTRHDWPAKAEAINNWYEEQIAEVDELVTKLEEKTKVGTADELEEEMAQIDKRLKPALERIRGVLRAIVSRQLAAMMAVEINDLIT